MWPLFFSRKYLYHAVAASGYDLPAMIKGLKELQAFDDAGKACADALAELIKAVTPLNPGNESKKETYKTDSGRWKSELEGVLKQVTDRSLDIIHDAHQRNSRSTP